MLSLLVFLPFIGITAYLIIPATQLKWVKSIALFITILQIIIFIPIIHEYKDTLTALIWEEKHEWIRVRVGSWGIFQVNYHLGLDSLNILLALLCLIIQPIVVLASWKVNVMPKTYFILLSLLNTSLLGCFLAQDLFLFYLFYELMLIPMYFLIGIWGGENRLYAAIKFFLYTLFGSVFMLLVMVGIHFSYVDPTYPKSELLVHTFNFHHLTDSRNLLSNSFFVLTDVRFWSFWGLFIAFAVKLPLVPLHTWLPDAHVQASTPISVLLAALLLKAGGYGLMRICWGFFPDVAISYAEFIAGLSVFSIIYGGLNALAQNDLKKMIAYSSVAHMGFVLLGLSTMTATAFNGAVFQMFTHGIISAMLFLCVGVLYDRVHNYQINNFRGLWQLMPQYSFVVFIAFFSGMGLPGLAPFVSELLVFAGSFQSSLISPYWVIISILGILISAGYFLWTIQRMFMGKTAVMEGDIWLQRLTDLTIREKLMLIPLVILALLGGLYPQIFLELIDEGLIYFIDLINK
jgi:NADH-quinone oxidoreductase subunit M